VHVSKPPTAERGILLGQHQQSPLLTAHPQIVLAVLKESPDICGIQIEGSALIDIPFKLPFAPWHPTQAITHSTDEEIAMTVFHGTAKEQVLAIYLTPFKIVLIHLAVTIV
jgi:hypothetical protein